jgi:hypothetical protein
MSDDGERQRYDLGVLFVHGIGQQARGQTLTAWADPVIRWLRAWAHAEPAPLAEAPVAAPVEGPAEAVLEPGGSA